MSARLVRTFAAAGALLAMLACTPSTAPPAATTAPAPTAAQAAPGIQAAPAKPSATTPPAPAKIDMPYGGRGVAGLVHYLAVEDGFYTRHGVEVSSPNIGSPPTLAAAVISGDAPIGTTGQEAVITAGLGGAEVAIVASQLTGIASSIIAQPSIRTAQDLRGKRMGATAFASPTHTGAVLFLRANGLEPQRDVALTPIGGMPEIRAALESGALEAASITPPLSYALAAAGYTELADLSTMDLKYHQGVLFTTRGYIQRQPDVLRRVLAGYAEAQRVVLTDKAAAQRVLGKWVNVTDPDELDKTYDLALRGFRHGPTVDPEGVQTSIDLLADTQPAARDLRAAQIIDNTFANAAATQYGFPTR